MSSFGEWTYHLQCKASLFGVSNVSLPRWAAKWIQTAPLHHFELPNARQCSHWWAHVGHSRHYVSEVPAAAGLDLQLYKSGKSWVRNLVKHLEMALRLPKPVISRQNSSVLFIFRSASFCGSIIYRRNGRSKNPSGQDEKHHKMIDIVLRSTVSGPHEMLWLVSGVKFNVWPVSLWSLNFETDAHPEVLKC